MKNSEKAGYIAIVIAMVGTIGCFLGSNISWYDGVGIFFLLWFVLYIVLMLMKKIEMSINN